nr:hypothetical protein [Robiginitalea sp. SC105]
MWAPVLHGNRGAIPFAEQDNRFAEEFHCQWLFAELFAQDGNMPSIPEVVRN